MNSWRPFPLLRLVFPFLAGIILECTFMPASRYQVMGLIALTILLVSARLFALFVKVYSSRWVSGFIFNLFFIVAGIQIANQTRISNDPDYIAGQPGGVFLACLTESPSETRYGFKATVSLEFIYTGSGWKRVAGNVLAYLKTNPGYPVLQFGDNILLKARIDSISDNSNPHTFNYSKYLRTKGITHRVFADPYAWKKCSLENGQILRKFAFQFRDKLLEVLRENNVTGNEFAVAAALLLGYVDDLSPDLMHDYAASGAMHVLSVSGMHVGIIYLFFEFLLGFMNKKRLGRWFKAIFLLAFIWFYACLTGLSPFVFRSAAMLTLPIIAKSMDRTPNMYNVIAASLLFMLAIDPFLILDVGFQLSYLAVIGLVVFYKPIYDLYVTSAWLPDKIWSVLAVSLAAQIATLPITLYVFHQFPNYFLITNLFVVPLSSLIIYVGIMLMAFGHVPFIAMFVAKILVFLIWLLNAIIHWIEGLPFSTITGIHLSSAEMFVLYLMIIAGFVFLTMKRIAVLYLFLITCIGFMVLMVTFKAQRYYSSRMLVFNVKNISILEFSIQDKAVIYYGNNKPTDGKMFFDNFNAVRSDFDAHGIQSHRAYWMGKDYFRPESLFSGIPVFRSGQFFQMVQKGFI